VAWLRGTQLHWCSPDWYWRVPGARVLLVVVFRACLSVLPPLSVGPLKPAPQLLQFNGYLRWSPFVQYAWRGWGAFTQLVGMATSAMESCYQHDCCWYSTLSIRYLLMIDA
jgi:hypothetical protein